MKQDWDYVIVGAGSAGAVLAARLSENPDTSVLLLEAGPDYRSADTPVAFHDRNLGNDLSLRPRPSMRDPEFFWSRIPARRNKYQQVFPYPRGRGMGGSSTVNGLCAIRAVPEDFVDWQQRGATGWSWEAMLPAFIRSESDHDYHDPTVHGAEGPIPVYREPESGWGGCDVALRDAALNDGYAWQDDTNVPGTGVGRFAMNIRDGRRVSTNDGYVEPSRSRPNLTIRGNAHVARLIFDQTGTRARGVELAGGEQLRVVPGGEVILSAGAVHSPSILLRSGIGSSIDLGRLGVGVRADLPVGKALQDHAILFVELPVDPASQQCVGNRPTNVVVRYSSGVGVSEPNDMALLATNHNYWFGRPTAGVAIQLNHAESRGTLRLDSLDPMVDPSLELELLDAEIDLARMSDAVDRVEQLMAHPSFKAIARGRPQVPSSRQELLERVKDVMHLSCTAPMGGPANPDAVLDEQCQVLGIEGVRVVDASAMPSIVRANLNLTVIAMAEFMADRIRQQHA